MNVWILVLIAQAAPVWEVTDTSTAAPGELAEGRLERRIFSKENRFILRAGFSYLSRADFYRNPGLSADFAWYPYEWLGVDFVSATGFFSHLSSTARSLRESTGLLPDSQRPIARVTAGARLAFAYGKFLVEALDTVVHVDAGASAHVGVLITNDAVNPAGDLGLGVQVRAFGRVLLWIRGSVVISYEERTTSTVASGPQGTLGVGLLL